MLLKLLGGEERPVTRGAAGLQRREGHVEDGALHVGVVLDVEHEHRLPLGGEHGGHALQEAAEQRRQEALLGHVLQTHRDAVGQHVVGDDGDPQRAEGDHVMEAIWKEERGRDVMLPSTQQVDMRRIKHADQRVLRTRGQVSAR